MGTLNIGTSGASLSNSGSQLSIGVIPCFSARATNGNNGAWTTGGNTSPYTPIPFDAVDVNRGSCYDGTSAKFTCTLSGIYQFNVSLISGSNDQWVRIWMAHQPGGTGTPNFIHKSQTDYGGSASADFQHTGMSCLYPCSVGDKVWVILDTAGAGTESIYCNESGVWSIFSGHLIST